jgi:hypothetical protein
MTLPDVHVLVADALLPALIVFTAIVVYVFGIRPVLRQNPAFKTIYDQEDTAFNALNMKLGGIKQKLTAIGLSAISFVLLAHDQIAPFVTQVGVDPSQILPKVPVWVWPISTIAALWLIQHFRDLADRAARKNAEALLIAGHSLAAPAPGLPVDTLPSPSPLETLPDKAG